MSEDRGEEIPTLFSGACVNHLWASKKENLRQSLEACQTNIQNETGHRCPMSMLGLWHPGSSVSHGLFGPRVLCGL